MSIESPNNNDSQRVHAPLLKRITSLGYTHNETEILDCFIDWVQTTGITPYPAQEEALLELASGYHVVLETPTGSGKSLVALGLHFKAMCEGKRSFYTAPIKALVSEKFFSLCELFGEENVGMLTGDASINWAAPIICCTAEVLSNMALRQGERTDADYVVMDEFHYYGDRDRGVAWEIPLLLLPKTQFLLMSATLGNTSAIEKRLRSDSNRKVRHVWSDDRPVPLDFEYRKTPLQQTVEDLCADRRSPIYVVSFTQRDCARFAQVLTSAKLIGKEEKRVLKTVLNTATFDTPYGKYIKKFLSNGIGLHHAGLLPKYRLLVQKLSQQSLLKVICGTDTLGVGVNIPIRTVVFSKLSKFDGKQLRLLTAREFKQISGRAGRKGFDDHGSVVCQAPQHVIKKRTTTATKPDRNYGKRRRSNRDLDWSEKDFERLRHAPPETLRSQFHIDHGMIINSLQRDDSICGKHGGYRDLIDIINRCHAGKSKKVLLRRKAAQLFRSLCGAKIILLNKEKNGVARRIVVDEELQKEFSLYHSHSLFLVEALETLSKKDPQYSHDVMSLVESVLEQPRPILYAQERKAKSELRAKLKAQHVPYEERLKRLESITHPKPNAREIYETFNLFVEHHPWIGEDNIKPKSIAREMVEGHMDFAAYVRKYKIESVEGLLLRYLSSVYGTLVRNVPNSAKSEDVERIQTYFRKEISSIDSSLLEEWETRLSHRGLGRKTGSQTKTVQKPDGPDSKELRARVLKELHGLVAALSEGNYTRAASGLRKDKDREWKALDLEDALVPFFKEHEFLRCDGDAKRADRTVFRPIDQRLWKTTQVLCDPDGENAWYLEGVADFNAKGASFALRKIGC